MHVTLLYGGRSAEHDVSVRSARFVARTLCLQHTVMLIGITRRGVWYAQPACALEQLCTGTVALSIQEDEKRRVCLVPGGGTAGAFVIAGMPCVTDVVFPVLHGSYGEDGTVQGLLEMLQVPYVGCGVCASALAMDKVKAKMLWQAAGLPVLPFVFFRKDAWRMHMQEFVAQLETRLGYPLFVKPAQAGSSVGASAVQTRAPLIPAIEAAFQWDEVVLVERYVRAREIECALSGNGPYTVHGAGEVIAQGAFYDYEEKYADASVARVLVTAPLETAQYEQITTLALRAYEALGLTGLARVDFFLLETGEVYVNEVNTMPGFTSISLFPQICQSAGVAPQDLMAQLLSCARERFAARAALSTDLHAHVCAPSVTAAHDPDAQGDDWDQRDSNPLPTA